MLKSLVFQNCSYLKCASKVLCMRNVGGYSNFCTVIRSIPTNIVKPSYVTDGVKAINRKRFFRNNRIEIKSESQIEGMRRACALARKVLNEIEINVKPGITTYQLDEFAHNLIISYNAYPSPLLYRGYPKSICTSVNEVACHGIPDNRPLQDGDMVSVDVTVYQDGFHGDCATTFYVGNVDETGRKLVEVAEKCRDVGIQICRPGQKFSAIGRKISSLAISMGFHVVPQFCGHGIGSYFHGPPDIFHFDNDFGGTMQQGMTFTIEPVISESSAKIIILEDGWTAVTADKSRAAQFEHTVLITSDGVEILT